MSTHDQDPGVGNDPSLPEGAAVLLSYLPAEALSALLKLARTSDVTLLAAIRGLYSNGKIDDHMKAEGLTELRDSISVLLGAFGLSQLARREAQSDYPEPPHDPRKPRTNTF